MDLSLWMLVRDWLLQQNNGWTVGEHGSTHLIENGEWRFYIGDTHIAGYPSCGSNLEATDPEFFNKLNERLTHVKGCDTCVALLASDKAMLSRLGKYYVDMNETLNDIQQMVNSCYRTMGKPLPYSTVKISL